MEDHAQVVAVAPVRVACCQLAPQVGNKQFNLEKTADFITRASAEGATVVVLPELSNSGYVFESRAEALSLADTYVDGETTALWAGLAKYMQVHNYEYMIGCGSVSMADHRSRG